MEQQDLDIKQQKAEQKKKRWNIEPYIAIGLTAFIVIIASMGVFFLMFRLKGIFTGLDMLISSLQSVIIGMVIAYLASPMVNFFERHILNFLDVYIRDERKKSKTARSLSILAALAVVLAIIGLLLGIMIPALIESLTNVTASLPSKINRLMKLFDQATEQDNEVTRQITALLDQASEYFDNFMKNVLPDKMQSIVLQVTTGVIQIGKFLLNIIIGFIVSVYVLFDKEKFCAQSKKVIYALANPKVANEIVLVARKSHEIFIGFIVGKIIDSVIIGLLTYVLMSMVGLPYALLVSVIVGVTNVIPFFGPFIGAIPSAILLFLDNPINGLYFLILVVIIQQIDGNIIGPKILGNSTGLSSFWVIVAILVSGGLFGVVGMLLGVPVFAVLFYLFTRLISYILRKKEFPVESSAYTNISHYDIKQGTFVEKDITEKKSVVPKLKILAKVKELLAKQKSEDK
jgi:predicted PurR-regulated permease PerM